MGIDPHHQRQRRRRSKGLRLTADVDHYRQEAERCLRLAARTKDPIERNVLQRMADELLRRSEVTELDR